MWATAARPPRRSIRTTASLVSSRPPAFLEGDGQSQAQGPVVHMGFVRRPQAARNVARHQRRHRADPRRHPAAPVPAVRLPLQPRQRGGILRQDQRAVGAIADIPAACCFNLLRKFRPQTIGIACKFHFVMTESSSSAVTAIMPADAQVAPAPGLRPLQHGDLLPGLRQPPADGQAGHAGADDDDLHDPPITRNRPPLYAPDCSTPSASEDGACRGQAAALSRSAFSSFSRIVTSTTIMAAKLVRVPGSQMISPP